MKAGSDAVDGGEDGGAADEVGLEAAFPGEVEKRDADEHGEDSLPGKEQHQDASNKKHGAEGVFENMPQDLQCGMVVFHPGPRDTDIKIVCRKADEDQGDGDE